MKAANDNNHDAREKRVSQLLIASTVLEQHLTAGLDTMLKNAGASGELRGAVQEFIRPALTQYQAAEVELINHSRRPETIADLLGKEGPKVNPEGLVAVLEGYAADVCRVAFFSEQDKVADNFRSFVTELGAAVRDSQSQEKDHDREL